MSIPVLNLAQMREWERATWATGQTEAEVIRRVGRQVAACALTLTRPGDAVLILAGKGHNGDDARASREFLADRKVILLNVTDPKSALAEFQKSAGVPPAPNRRDAGPALIIDGLFGIGLSRELDDGWKELIAAVNATKISVLAVDVPSGLNAETGEHFGVAIEAAVTLTVGAPKTGLLAPQAWPFVGRLEVADNVGLTACPLPSDLNWTLPDDFQNFPPPRPVADHKGSFGHVAIIAGSAGFHGAAVLATRGAQRAQPGLVTLFTQENVYPVVAAQLQAAMVKVWQPEAGVPDGVGAVLVGPGLAAPDMPAKLRHGLRHWWRDLECPLIVDASAIDYLAAEPFPKNRIRVLTPHPGEAARLLKTTADKIQRDRVGSLREISRRHGNCWVVLKGHQTLVGCAEGDVFVNPSGNPHLAQGGSGDVLAGFIAGLLAQPALQADAGKTIRYAVWQHGAAADVLQAQSSNWVIEDLAGKIGGVRR